MTAFAFEGVEASVSRETDFPCEDFRAMIHSLAEASIKAKARLGALEQGRSRFVGFIEPDDFDSIESPT